jgi:tRNA A37 threonylcarbamoyladenosine synthetase subunit TsaC/SUA5/YrdC
MVALVLARIARPLVATSANPSGRILDAEAENRWLGQHAAAGDFLWARPLRYSRRPASTVIDLTGSRPRELRAGPVSADAWGAVL